MILCLWMHVTFYWEDHDYMTMKWSTALEPALIQSEGVTKLYLASS
jgi:hypothetical protein